MDTQVIVVGAGPVGLMLAGELRLGGADVVVLERLAEPTTESRASTVHARTMELFGLRGLLDDIEPPPHEPMSHFGGLPLDLGATPSRYAGQWKILQAEVERMLGRWAAGLGAQIRRQQEVVGIAAEHDGVHVQVAGPARKRELVAAYVVGCDGEQSAVRRLAGIGFPGKPATRELVRADVDGISVHNRRFERLPGGLAIAARRPDGVTRIMASGLGSPAGDRRTEHTFAEVVDLWQAVTGEDISTGVPLWVNSFGNASRQAQRYRAGRVLLAGDAAHQQMPVGGQAINLGLQDAVNLGWKLAAVVRGFAPEELLDTYDEERRAVGRAALGNIEAQALLLLGGAEIDPLREVLRELLRNAQAQARLAAMISGLDVRYGADDDPWTGARLPDPVLLVSERGRSVADWLRAGRGVLVGFHPDRARELPDRGDRVGRITAPHSAVPAIPDAVLIRPDGHLAWTSASAGDLGAALRRWFGPSVADAAVPNPSALNRQEINS